MRFQDVYPQIADAAARYHYKEPPKALVDLQELISRVIRWLIDLLNSFKIFAPGATDTRMASNVLSILLWSAGLICACIIVFLAFTRLRHLKLQSELAKKGAAESKLLFDSATWLMEAEDLASKAEYKGACRALYFSILRMLDEKEVLEFTPTKTNYEYWYSLAVHRGIQRQFRELADLVELIWFGDYQAMPQDYKICHELHAAIKAEIESESQAALSGGVA
jgi:hypothetical protein